MVLEVWVWVGQWYGRGRVRGMIRHRRVLLRIVALLFRAMIRVPRLHSNPIITLTLGQLEYPIEGCLLLECKLGGLE